MFEINKRRENGVTILEIKGVSRFDAKVAGEGKTKLLSALDDAADNKFLLDISAVEHMDSAGLSAIISLNREIGGRKGTLKICGLSPTVRSLFELTRLHRVFELIDGNASQALESF